MKTFKYLIGRLRPANRLWQYMEVKELSERMQMAQRQAIEANMVLLACEKAYYAAAEQYMAQCKARKVAA